MMRVPEECRVTVGDFKTNKLDGNNGVFVIDYGSQYLQCIVSDGMGWEHVSVTVRDKKRKNLYETPHWEVMCHVKEIFWDDEDVVIQYHPKKSEYVNNHPHVLHLWRPTSQEIPYPDSILVGIK